MAVRTVNFLLLLSLSTSCNGATEETSDGDSVESSGGSQNTGDGDSSGNGGVPSGAGGIASGGISGSESGGTGGAHGSGDGGASEVMGGQGGNGGEPTTGGGGAGAGGSAEPDHIPTASSGCDLAFAEPRDLGVGDHTSIYISTPEGYDGSTPVPLVIALSANGGNLSPMETLAWSDSTPSDLARDFLLARSLRRSGTEHSWENAELEDYDEAYELMERTLCFDESRVFGVGNAAGGRFLARFIHEDSPSDAIVRPKDFRAIAFTGAIYLGSSTPWPEIPIVFIHSIHDQMAAWLTGDDDGAFTILGLQDRLACSEGSAPAGSSTYDGTTTTCTDFTTCSSPLRFCSYDQPTDLDQWQSLYTTEVHRFFSQHL